MCENIEELWQNVIVVGFVIDFGILRSVFTECVVFCNLIFFKKGNAKKINEY